MLRPSRSFPLSVESPAFRYLIRRRASVLQGAVQHDREDVSAAGFQTASSRVELGVTPGELGALLRSYVDGIHPAMALAIAERPELVGAGVPSNPWGPLQTWLLRWPPARSIRRV